MGRGNIPQCRASTLDLAIIACIVAMVTFNLYELSVLASRVETNITMTANAHSFMIGTDARPIAYCAWTRT